MKKIIKGDEEKNQILQLQRGLSFEIVVECLAKGDILSRRVHHNKDKYPNQYIFILKLNSYICYVPFTEDENEIFLKTIIPSRKLKKEFKK
jgi:uncharacterized DUF497 family protein